MIIFAPYLIQIFFYEEGQKCKTRNFLLKFMQAKE